jgi:hypothetical protein
VNDTSQNLETAALLALLRAPGARWQQIADDVEEAGSARHVLEHASAGEQTSLFSDAPEPTDLTAHIAELHARASAS